MVLDTSALIAILRNEPEALQMVASLEAAPSRLISAATLLESSIVMQARYGDAGVRELDTLIQSAGIEIVAVSAEQVEIARRAFRAFGKGVHPAGLNFGDCFSYALAKALDEPLLYVGNDFSQTDVTR